MNVGTRSLLFGVHQFLWHPLTVWLAWRRLYGSWPNWWQVIAIFCHDLGYWGCPNMDGKEGKTHPHTGAYLAADISSTVHSFFRPFECEQHRHAFWLTVESFTVRHSRELSKETGVEPSKLCWADKYCVVVEPRWFYLLRARLSGELNEYLGNAHPIMDDLLSIRYMNTWKETKRGQQSAEKYWLEWYREKVCNLPEIKKLLTK